LREELQLNYGENVNIKIKIDNSVKTINLEKFRKKINTNKITENDIKIIDKLLQKLYQVHKKTKKRISAFSLAGLFTLIIATTLTSLFVSTVFPEIFKSYAATYTFTQTDWSGGESANTAIHPDNQSNWIEYETKDTYVSATSSVAMSLEAFSITEVNDADFNAGSTSTAEVIGTGDEAYIKLASSTDATIAVSAGWTHACALYSNKTVKCWGNNADGQLGDNSNTPSASPVSVYGLTNVEQISAGGYHTCARITDGTVKCWGKNSNGQLGNNSTYPKNHPVDVYSLTNVISISAGTYHTCALISDGTIKCWGQGLRGEMGNGAYDITNKIPVQVSDITTATKISMGYYTSCALLSDGAARCWGYNLRGPLGDGTETKRNIPIEPQGIDGITNVAIDIDTGVLDTCVVLNDNSVKCWGANSNGQIGIGTVTQSQLTPITVTAAGGAPLAGVQEVSVGGYHVCVRTTGNTVKCWGKNSLGEVGDGTETANITRAVDIPIASLSDVYSISTSNQFTCARLSDSRIKCWGNDNYNQLGDNRDYVNGYTNIPNGGVSGVAGYYTVGTFTSQILDTVLNANYGLLTVDSTTPANTFLELKVRSGNDPNLSDASDWDSCSVVETGADITASDCASDTDRYIQYQAVLTTWDVLDSPQLETVTINYSYYPSSQTLISSPFNTTDATNALSRIEWTETLPAGADIKFQIRTASTSAGLTSASFLGPTGIEDYYTDPTGGETINAVNSDSSEDQWIQYKVFLSSEGLNSPVLSDITLTYVVNAPPEAQNVTASQGSDGLVSISYDVRDPDTSSGAATPGYITPSFQYWNGSSWVNCTTMATGDTDNQSVNIDGTTWTTHTATWTPAIDFANQYMNNTAQIKVIVNDNEPANNISSEESLAFILDTAPPSSTSIKVNATTIPASLNLSAIDDSSFQMKISLNSDLSGANWETYNPQTTISLVSDPDTVYAQFKDEYENQSDIINVTTPETPQYSIIRDITNLDTMEYSLFIAWKTADITDPDFAHYYLWRSVDGINYSILSDITDRAVNYYFDRNLDGATTYYYKMSQEDANGNTSYFSSIVSDMPDGQGGSDTTAPTISNTAISSISTAQATITWATDELSNSTVGYSTTAGSFTTETGVATMATTHTVVLTNLTPNTTYYFQVKSIDPSNNIGTDNNDGDGYVFTTNSGAAITAGSITASNIENTTAIIEWKTDINSNSYVVYSTNSDLSSSTETGNTTLVTNHSVTVSNLTQGTKYYYYVKSTDAEENEAIDNNGGEYYMFTTTADTTAPTISNVSAISIADTTATITWNTDEGATSKVEYGATSGDYTLSTAISENLDFNHSASLSELTANTTYYYHVISTDANENMATSTEYSFTTLETLSEESEVVAREDAAREEGVLSGSGSGSGGGGIMIIDKTDKTSPVILNIKVSDIKGDSAMISWETDEDTFSFLDYGKTTKYGNIIGDYKLSSSHSIAIKLLSSETDYHYRIVSVDSSGNLSQSQDQTFTTLTEKKELTEEEKLFNSIEELADTNKSKDEILVDAATAAKKAINIIKGVSSQVSVGKIEETISAQLQDLKELGNLVPPPLMSSDPKVITTATSAMIAWRTDKESNSLVAISPETDFNIAKNKKAPYMQTVGQSEDRTKEHIVTIYDLKPNIIYHYQIKSQADLGPMAKSQDFIFKTKAEQLEITSYTFQIISNEKTIFKWLTNYETDTNLKYIPYRNGKLIVDEAKTKTDENKRMIHEITLNDLEAGTIYQIELFGKDIKNQTASKIINTFSTSKDDLPPIIYQVQTESALSPGKDSKVQTIISWFTNEPTNGRIYFSKGIVSEIDLNTAEKTALDENFTKKHVAVITKFNPGAVYSFKVESSDSGGNAALSKVYTILAPRQKETVFQVIMKNLEDVFGWIGKIKQ